MSRYLELHRGSKTYKNNLRSLMATLTELKSKLETLNQNAVRNRKLDFKILTQNELNQKLLKGTEYENRQLVLTQIGYLRINLFQEYYERIQAAQANQDLMNDITAVLMKAKDLCIQKQRELDNLRGIEKKVTSRKEKEEKKSA